MISPEQERFLEAAFTEAREAGRPWRILANQIPMARVHVPPLRDPLLEPIRAAASHPAHAQLEALTRLGDADLPIYLDTWDGYPWARERLYGQLHGIGVEDLLVLTGDSHAFWLNALADEDGRPVGIELGTTGVTSPGDFVDFGEALARHIDGLLARHNTEVQWTDSVPRGWLRVALEPEEAVADYMTVSDVASRHYTTARVKRVRLLRRDGRLLTET
jgi:phosphodiesterase/alkaline phosphatase D-like protein